MGSNPSSFEGDDRPVEAVSWGRQRGIRQEVGREDGSACPPSDGGGVGIRLPGGDDHGLPHGKRAGGDEAGGLVPLRLPRRHDGDGAGRAVRANAWGLFDYGTSREWMADGFADYSDKDVEDPQGAEKDTCRVLRGGSWYRGPG